MYYLVNILFLYLRSKFSYVLRSFRNWFNFWQFCLVFGFVLGFTISFSWQSKYSPLLIVSILLIFLIIFLIKRKFYVFIFLICLLLGFWHHSITINNLNDRIIALLNSDHSLLERKIYRGLVITNKQEKNFYSYIDVLLVDNIQVRLQIPKYEDIKYLQTIEFSSKFYLPEEKINDFYYRSFLFSKNIYLIGKEVEIKDKYFNSIINNLISEFKLLVEKTINFYIHEPYSAITNAILIGNKNDIPNCFINFFRYIVFVSYQNYKCNFDRKQKRYT